MRTFTVPLFLVSSLGASATPAWARSGDQIEFGYTPQELVTEQSREALLKRIKSTTRAACRGIQATGIFYTPKRCRDDVEKQIVEAIGSAVLIAQYEGDPVTIARSGS